MTDWPDLPRAVVCWTHLSSDERSRYLEGRRRQGEDTRAVWAARRAALQLDAVAIERPAESDAELRLLSEREAMLAAALWALADAESAMVEGAVRPGPGSGRTRAPEAGDAGGEAPVRHE
jgi:hypothetical protein